MTITFSKFIMQDATNGSWWLTFGNDGHVVGYWPKKLCTYMADSANIVGLIGTVGAAVGEPWEAVSGPTLKKERQLTSSK